MLFDYTQKDKNQQLLASFIGVQLQPIGYQDLAVLVVWSVVYFLHFLFIIYLLVKRRPRIHIIPIALYISATFWFVGDLITNSLIHPVTALLRSCVTTIVWFRSILGAGAFLFILIIYALQPTHYNKLYIALSVTTLLTLGVVSTLISPTRTIRYVEFFEVCQPNEHYKVALTCLLYIILGLLLLTVLWFSHTNRPLICVTLCMLFCFIYNTAVWFTHPKYPSRLGWRLSVICIDQIAIWVSWWCIVFVELKKNKIPTILALPEKSSRFY